MKYFTLTLIVSLVCGVPTILGTPPQAPAPPQAPTVRLYNLEKKVEDLESRIKVVEAANTFKGVNSTECLIPDCKCGCMETGSCKCKNCKERTADPTYKNDTTRVTSSVSKSHGDPVRLGDGKFYRQRLSDGVYEWCTECNGCPQPVASSISSPVGWPLVVSVSSGNCGVSNSSYSSLSGTCGNGTMGFGMGSCGNENRGVSSYPSTYVPSSGVHQSTGVRSGFFRGNRSSGSCASGNCGG